MATTIKAIETIYKGYRFRSRLEARWAVFLDSLNETWEYEVEGYQLPSGWYLPDFWLPRLYCWLEIKGVKPTDKETLLCSELAHGVGKPVAIAWGLPFASKMYYHDGKYIMDERIAKATLACPMRSKYVVEGKANPVFEAYTADRLYVYCSDSNDSGSGEGWWDECFWAIDKNEQFCICSNNGRTDRCFGPVMTYAFMDGTSGEDHFNYYGWNGMKQTWDIQGPIQESHVDKVKAARFEFNR